MPCLVVSCSWRCFSREAPAFCGRVESTHAVVDFKATCAAQFLQFTTLHVELLHEVVEHGETLLATLCCVCLRSHYMPSYST
jgi:hypothetical protein